MQQMPMNRCRPLLGKVLAVALITAFVVAAHTGRAAAQDYDVVTIDGRVLWIAGQTMVVSPYGSGAGPASLDLSSASLDEHMKLTTGDSGAVAGTIPIARARDLALAIR